MNERIEPADAARALSDISQQRERVLRRAVIPGWYWWAIAVLTVPLAAGVEFRGGTYFWVGILVFVAGSLVIQRPLARALRSAPPRRELTALIPVPGQLLVMAAFLVAVFGVGLATGLSLKAAGVSYPGTIATAAAMVVFAVGGQLLVRYYSALLVRRAARQG